jgi:hypothetical protein
MKDRRTELLERANLSRERLAASGLAGSGQAWKLWNAMVASMVDNVKAADQTYAGTLASSAGIDRTDTGRLMRQMDELGIVGWKAAPRASKGISELSLPVLPRDVMPEPAHDASARMKSSDVMPQPACQASDVMPEPALPSNGEGTKSLHIGLQASEPLGNENLGSPEVIGPPRDVMPSLKFMSDLELLRCYRERPETMDAVKAEIAIRVRVKELERRFGSLANDERTGDGVGDDEASMLRWEHANPTKARRRGD